MLPSPLRLSSSYTQISVFDLMRRALGFIGKLVIGSEESPVLRDRLMGGVSGLLTLRVAFSAFSFAGTVLLARLLGQAGFGFYSYAFAWTVLIMVPAVLGMDQLLVREVAAYHAKAEWGLLRSLLHRASWAVLLASTVLALLAAAVAWLVLRGRPSTELSTLWVALVLVPLVALTRVRQATMQGLHRVVLGSLPDQVIQPGLLLAGLAVFLWFHTRLTPPVAMGVTVMTAAVSFAVGAILLNRILPEAAKGALPTHQKLELANSALPILLITGIGVLFGQADTLILGALKGPATVGAYTVAHKGAEFVGYPLVVQNAAFASTVASLYAVGDREKLQRLVTRLARWTLLAATPVAVGLIVGGKWFLSLYGAQFAGARLTLAILSGGQLVNVATGSVGILLVMTGNERQAAISSAVGAVANVGLAFVLVPRWGSEGAAIAYAIGMTLWNVVAAVAVNRSATIDSTALGNLSRSRSQRRLQ